MAECHRRVQMTWYANQIYARPTADVIAAFRTLPFLADQMYHVDDLRGVRNQWSREMLLSGKPPKDRKHLRHGLPEGGLLVVHPEIYETGYDRRDLDASDITRHSHRNNPCPNAPPSAKWASVDAPEPMQVLFPPAFEPDYFSLGLLQFLKWVYSRTSSPVIYYQCAMWGGGIEKETAWIMSVDERVYQHQDDGTVIEHTADDQRTVSGDLLQLAMRHVGLDLPTRFFALHEASFHWKLYRMHRGRGVGML